MKYGLRLGVIALLAIAGLALAIAARHGARADVDNTTAISCIFLAGALTPTDACDGLDAADIDMLANTTGDEDGTLERTDLEDLDLDANQITETSFGESSWLTTIYVIAFVDDDGPVTFDADSGITVDINDDGNADDPSPADDLDVETCDGDDDADCGTSTLADGDGVVVATVTTTTIADPGDQIDVDVEQEGTGGTETLTVVGVPDEVALTLVETVIQANPSNSDCANGDPEATEPAALSNLDSTIAIAVVTDNDETPLTRIVTDISSDDTDIAQVGDSTEVTVDAGASGIASFTVICGADDTGTADINVDIVGESDSATIAVTGEPANIALTASPAAIDCNGDQASTVTATVTDEFGFIVANGTPVTFSVVALGVADPINTLTFDGVASSSIKATPGNESGITVIVSAGDASASIRIDCGAPPPSPPSGPPRAIQLKATPERISCDGNEPSRIRVRVLDDNDQPVLDGTYVEFVTEGEGDGWFSEQQVSTSNGEATTEVWFQAYDPSFPPFAFDVRATAGMLSGSIRVYCNDQPGCVSPPVSPPVDPLSPPCEPPPFTPTPVPPDCERGNSGRVVSPPCNEPGRPLSPPRCENNGRGQGRGNLRCATPTPPSPPQCVDAPSASVSPPCATPTPPSPPPCEWPFSPPNCGDEPTPPPARLALDCDLDAAGVQEDCGPLPDGASSLDIGIVLQNLTDVPSQLTSFDAMVVSPDESALRPVQGAGSLGNNPNFNETDLGTLWGCDVESDADPSPSQALSEITCFNAGPLVNLPASGDLTLATVRYTLGPNAEGKNAHLELASGSVGGFNGAVVAECSSCSTADIELPADIPDATPTPTPTMVPDQPPAQALESVDETATPENAYFVAIDCDLAQPGVQDRCTYDVNATVIDVGFVIEANMANCGLCNVGAFNFVVIDPDRARLDPPPGHDLNLESNPDFNQSLQGGWQCVPPPPDNNTLPSDSPEARSFLSCFSSTVGSPLPAGGQVLGATVRYAVPENALPGTVTLDVRSVSVGDDDGHTLVDCPITGASVFCRPATITLVDTSPTTTPTSTPTPPPARLALDCDLDAPGTQTECGPLPDGNLSTDVGIVFDNVSTAPVFLWSFEARVRSPDVSVLGAAGSSSFISDNPSLNEDDLGTEWNCTSRPDDDASTESALSVISCTNIVAPVFIAPAAQVTLATVRYEYGRQAPGAIGRLDLTFGQARNDNGQILASCTNCASVKMQLPDNIPFPTTPTPTPVPEEPHTTALDSIDATGTPASAYFAALDCDLNRPGVQDQCSYALDAGLIDVGFVIVANVDDCIGACDLGAFNFVVNDPDRSRLDPPPGSDENLDANPDFREQLLTQVWSCWPPAPDNNRLPDDAPQAESFLSCFASAEGAPWGPHGALRPATIRYAIPEAATPGDVALSLSELSVGNFFGDAVIDCPTAGNIFCRPATITLVDTTGQPVPTNTAVPTATPTNTGGLIPISIELTDTPTAVPTATPTPAGSGLLPLACADVTGDGAVTLADVAVIGTKAGGRDRRTDVTRDGKTNMKDVLAAVRQLNRTC